MLLFTDNQAVMYILQKWYSKNKALRLEVSRIIDLLRLHNVDLAAQYINTAENVLADALSRAVDEKKVWLTDEFLDALKKKSLVRDVITHKRLESIGDEFSL